MDLQKFNDEMERSIERARCAAFASFEAAAQHQGLRIEQLHEQLWKQWMNPQKFECSACHQWFEATSFSNTQRRKKAEKRRCKSCVEIA